MRVLQSLLGTVTALQSNKASLERQIFALRDEQNRLKMLEKINVAAARGDVGQLSAGLKALMTATETPSVIRARREDWEGFMADPRRQVQYVDGVDTTTVHPDGDGYIDPGDPAYDPAYIWSADMSGSDTED